MKPNAMADRSDTIGLPHLNAATAQGARRADARALTWLERRWSVVRNALRAASVCAFLAAITLHPAFISRYISSDGQLEEGSRQLLYALEGIALLGGMVLLVLAEASRRHTPLKE